MGKRLGSSFVALGGITLDEVLDGQSAPVWNAVGANWKMEKKGIAPFQCRDSPWTGRLFVFAFAFWQLIDLSWTSSEEGGKVLMGM